MNVDAYLERIGMDSAELRADIETLRKLQYQHLLSIPFENLDIHWKRPIVLDIDKFSSKILGENRGGFCYELNGLFNELLISLGFKTRLISARVFNGTVHGPEYDHAAIIVKIDKGEYLTDVGFGDFAAQPLRFVLEQEQADPTGVFMIRRFDDDCLEVAKLDGDTRKSQYIFKDIARDLSEFAEMCDFQQYSPESHFTKGKVCSIMTINGRKTLTDKKFIITTNGTKSETEVGSVSEFDRLLNDEFGIRPLQ